MSAPGRKTEVRSSIPYVLPFLTFLAFLGLTPHLAFMGQWEFLLRVVVLAAVLAVFSRHVIDLKMAMPLQSILLGIAVFAIWIGPDLLFPQYRSSALFQNSITGTLQSSIDESLRSQPAILAIRSLRAVVLVPIIEELFWRAWMLRWLINPHFEDVPLGAYNRRATWVTAILFASEHGPYWDVGLVTGLIYNWWMFRTRRLGDCIVAHAVTNACLSAYVVISGKWEYWL
jgi:CAAX prenyl protease-like protein